MKKCIYFFIVILFYSCSYGIDFEIKNQSSMPIKNITITNGFNIAFLDSIGANKEELIFLDFKKNNTKSDGNFGIEYEKDSIKYFNYFGYYSNGIPSKERMTIIFNNDTLNIE